jgi:hypothetical protein
VRIQSLDGDNLVHTWFAPGPGGAYNEFNGLWLNVTAQMPANYTGSCLTGAGGTGWWQFAYVINGATAHDWVNIQFSLVGSPVHLVLPA